VKICHEQIWSSDSEMGEAIQAEFQKLEKYAKENATGIVPGRTGRK
jgi:hypothetical protein